MKKTTISKTFINVLLICILFTVQNLASQTDNFVSTKKGVKLSTGISMKYLEFGSENEETIVLLHGYTDTSRSYKDVIQGIQKIKPKFRIICPDLRGHGDSSLPTNYEDFRIEDFSNDILALMNHKNVSKFHLVGHSFGGMIAQDIAVNHPERIESLILISTLSDATINSAINDFLMEALIFGQWKSQLIANFGSEWKDKSYQLTTNYLGEEVLNFLKENWVTEDRANSVLINEIYQETINTPLATWFETLNHISQFHISSKLEHLKVPTLVIWGADDELMPNNPDQSRLKSNLKSAYQNHQTPVFYKTYSKSDTDDLHFGHNLHWAIPNEIANDIIGFIVQNQNIKTYNHNTINIGNTDSF